MRRIECVPYAELSRPARATHRWKIRANCRLEICGCSRNRIRNKYRLLLASSPASHSPMALRICSVISNCTGRPVFFWITVRSVANSAFTDHVIESQPMVRLNIPYPAGALPAAGEHEWFRRPSASADAFGRSAVPCSRAHAGKGDGVFGRHRRLRCRPRPPQRRIAVDPAVTIHPERMQSPAPANSAAARTAMTPVNTTCASPETHPLGQKCRRRSLAHKIDPIRYATAHKEGL